MREPTHSSFVSYVIYVHRYSESGAGCQVYVHDLYALHQQSSAVVVHHSHSPHDTCILSNIGYCTYNCTEVIGAEAVLY